ncbi:interleukin-1 receptor-associated kinase 4 isoform X2 [Anabrus simplex]|uniref:interleukin-1 receptor-associated kinase 4 isoform X2 n=1 Tax=Anabrus simplex TaxID=316456 RepID=UPI0034DD8283
MARELEIRKLQSKNMYQLVHILEYADGWKKLMAVIPKNNTDQHFESKYTFEHFKMIEHAGVNQKRPCSEILLEEWSTSGRKRPNLSLLLELLLKAELFRAAEYVAVDLLKEPAPKRPETGIAADTDISDETIQKILNAQAENAALYLKEHIPKYHKGELFEKQIVMNFSEKNGAMNEKVEKVMVPEKGLVERIAIVLNENETQEASLGIVSEESPETRSGENRQSDIAEIEDSSIVENTGGVEDSSLQLNTALPHVSYSELEQCTANFCEELLTSHHQINEGRKLGTGAFGSVYLGVYSSNNYVAVKKLKRDVVNIEKQFKNEVDALSRYQHPHLLPLLGYSCDGPAYCLVYEFMCNGSLQERLACQLGDFGLVRLGVSGQQSHSIALTSTVFGTSAYMAPEAFRGDISVKLDSFSFGVVILELLTSLPPYDEKREGCDLVTHVEDICEGSIEPLLDTKAGDWGKSVTVQPAESLYSIALDCLKEKRHRPNMDSVVKSIQEILLHL